MVLNRQLSPPLSWLSRHPAEISQDSVWMSVCKWVPVLHFVLAENASTGMEEEIHLSLDIKTEIDLHSFQYRLAANRQ